MNTPSIIGKSIPKKIVIRDLLKKLLSLQGLEIRKSGNFISNPLMAQKLFSPISNPTIIDVGANHGETAKAYRSIFPESRIYCIEPCSDSFIELNHLQEIDPLISAHNVAIADICGFKEFYENELAVTNSLLPVSKGASRAWGNGKIKPKKISKVECVTLDQFASNHHINKIEILKLDIQGGERMAIAGAEKLLTEKSIDLIFMEVILADTYEGQPMPLSTLANLSEAGYTPIGFYNMLYANKKLIQFDALLSCK